MLQEPREVIAVVCAGVLTIVLGSLSVLAGILSAYMFCVFIAGMMRNNCTYPFYDAVSFEADVRSVLLVILGPVTLAWAFLGTLPAALREAEKYHEEADEIADYEEAELRRLTTAVRRQRALLVLASAAIVVAIIIGLLAK
ncbi:MAG TPA: hypothetical protein VHC21_03950 [Candidatus Saccharimonadales bacterium]|nr:hypothetical protein [Candidatus Saccharimonadales bacterium]